jgi:hypothetical protein
MTLLTPQRCLELMAELAKMLPGVLSPRLPPPPGFPELPVFEILEITRQSREPVFVGGGIVSLLVTDPSAPPPSRTKDIDVVLEIAGYEEFVAMEHQLQRAGFSRRILDNPSIFRWWWREVIVDFLPDRPNHLVTNTNRWFRSLVQCAERAEVLPGRFLWRASAPCYLATKFEAFRSRGEGDYLGSKDIEDIVAVMDGRPELIRELPQAPFEVRGFLAMNATVLLANDSFMDSLPRLLADAGREKVVERRLQEVASMT